jgi:hypothetical protein
MSEQQREALEVETFWRQDLGLGENLRCVSTYLGPRVIKAKFVHVTIPGSLSVSNRRRWFDAWRETGELPPRTNRSPSSLAEAPL